VVKNRNLSIGCLGILVVLAAGIVFGSESILALMRKRDISATIAVVDPNTGAVTAQSKAASAQATPQPTLVMLPNGSIAVHLAWTYKIGPRFPITVITTNVSDSQNNVVTTDMYKIDCGSETLDCSNSVDRVLGPPKGGTWTAGTYRVDVAFSRADLAPTFAVASQMIRVG